MQQKASHGEIMSVTQRLAASFRWIDERRAKWRLPILFAALALFVIGSIVSFRSMDIRWDEIQLAPLLFLVAVLVPLNIIYSAINMMLMGRASNVRITLTDGIRISAFAQVAEMLPIPGGAIVRTAALMKAGVGGLRSTGLVLAFSILWVACAAIGGGIALVDAGLPAFILLAAGSGMATATIGWLGWKFDWGTALLATVLRVLGIALVGWRIVVAFTVIGVAISWMASLTFAFTVILGTAASIVPAGLGVGESLSALVADRVSVAPAAAFLAAAIARFTGFVCNMVIVGFFVWTKPASPTQLAHD
jgi:hypothetical protein